MGSGGQESATPGTHAGNKQEMGRGEEGRERLYTGSLSPKVEAAANKGEGAILTVQHYGA